MPDPFFAKPSRKRKRILGNPSGSHKKPNGRARDVDEDDDVSGVESGEAEDVASIESSEDQSANETAPEKRLRLAKGYLEGLRTEVDAHGFDAEDVDRDLLAQRLREDVAEEKGRVYRRPAATLDFRAACIRFGKAKYPLTGIAASPGHVYTTTKGGLLMKWDVSGQPKLSATSSSSNKADRKLQGHTGGILCIAASADGKFVATGGQDKRIVVRETLNLSILRVFKQHRDAVLGLSCRRGTNQMYSCSADRTVKLFSLDELTYIDTLFGHQDIIPDICSLAQERCVTIGARDRTARLWKIIDESQLVFRSPAQKSLEFAEGSIDCVAMLDEQHFVTGSDNGSISLWSLQKKKPLFTQRVAHGCSQRLQLDEFTADAAATETAAPPVQPRWITALAALPYSDLFFSGSWSSTVIAWKVSEDMRRFEQVGEVSGVTGVVNDLAIIEHGKRLEDGITLLAATGQESRLGRWIKLKGQRNCAYLIKLPQKSAQERVNGNTNLDGKMNGESVL